MLERRNPRPVTLDEPRNMATLERKVDELVAECRAAGRFPSEAHATMVYTLARQTLFTEAYWIIRGAGFDDDTARKYADDIACNRAYRLVQPDMLVKWVFNTPRADQKSPFNYLRMCAKRRAKSVITDSGKKFDRDFVDSLDRPVRTAHDPDGEGATIQIAAPGPSPEQAMTGTEAVLLDNGFTEIQIALISSAISLQDYTDLGHATCVSDAHRQKVRLLAKARSLLLR
jgi:hypothetical protein